MKDLFVLTADADSQAVMRGVLQRHTALDIRKISYDVERHVGRDPGMIHSGPELVRFQKGKFTRVLLIWDHQGSGREKDDREKVQKIMADRLDAVSWKDNHLTIIAVPELEEWLWFNTESILKYLNISQNEMDAWVGEFAKTKSRHVELIRREQPKELFEHLVFKKERRKPRPLDFEKIAAIASLAKWQQSPSFGTMIDGLRHWFPKS